MARSIQCAVDSADFFVQAADSTPLNISATATGTQNSADQVNTLHKGAIFGLAIVTVAATCTLRMNVQAKDPQSLIYYTIASLSVDGLSIAVAGGPQFVGALEIYPAVTGTPANLITPIGIAMPRTFRVQVSLTATASGGGAATSYSVSQTKVL